MGTLLFGFVVLLRNLSLVLLCFPDVRPANFCLRGTSHETQTSGCQQHVHVITVRQFSLFLGKGFLLL